MVYQFRGGGRWVSPCEASRHVSGWLCANLLPRVRNDGVVLCYTGRTELRASGDKPIWQSCDSLEKMKRRRIARLADRSVSREGFKVQLIDHVNNYLIHISLQPLDTSSRSLRKASEARVRWMQLQTRSPFISLTLPFENSFKKVWRYCMGAGRLHFAYSA